MRIARALALAGVSSRRRCEAHILAGEVFINGEVVRDLGRQVDPGKQRLTFRGKQLAFQQHLYFLLHKPAGYTTTVSDPCAEKTVYALLPLLSIRVFPVGRLDRDSTGLLLFTNDGELANRLTHPRYKVGRWYTVGIDRPLDSKAKHRLLQGIPLEEGVVRAEQVVAAGPREVRLEMKESKKREIRRMFEAIGYRVMVLRRVALGPLKLGSLPLGKGRSLSAAEVAALKRAACLPV
jgi:23S rRNA pseudouridine2605 synthase